MMKKKIVLIGGGHTHTLVLRDLNPCDHHITLVSESESLLYTGMLPGFIAGHYGIEDISINLPRLCRRAGVEFLLASVKAINDNAIITDKGKLSFDIASLNLGVHSSFPADSQAEGSLPLKPLTRFISNWESLLDRKDRMHLVVVGGGAASLEVVLALAWQFKECRLSLIAAEGLLPGYANRLVKLARRRLAQADIQLREQTWVETWRHNSLLIRSAESTKTLAADYVFWATNGVPPSWLCQSPLSLDDAGFVKVNNNLQSLSHPNIFAVGDIASLVGHSLPKAGVFAVRQAPYLRSNLLAMAKGRQLTAYHPQKEFLTLLSLGNKTALGQRGKLAFAGNWVWYWKNYLDKNFVRSLLGNS